MSTTDQKLIESDFEKAKNNFRNALDLHLPALNEMGMKIKEKSLADVTFAAAPLAARGSAPEQITANSYWWGIEIVMNKKMTEDIINGVATTGTIGGAIASAFGGLSLITAGVAAVIGAGIAGVVALKIAQIKIADNGNGVKWPITWLQWAALIAAVPMGPVGILTAGALFLHPIRN